MKKRIFIYLITAQIAIVGGLVLRIYQQKQVLGAVSINPIRSEDIISYTSGGLKYFWEPKPNYIIKENSLPGFSAINTINSDSLNARFDYPIEKPKTTYRIITLGASFTFGLHVDTKDNYSSLLEDKLNSDLSCKNFNKFEVINLGVSGYDTSYEVERYRKRGEKYNPDLIIWYFSELMNVDEEIAKKYLDKLKTPNINIPYQGVYPNIPPNLVIYYRDLAVEKVGLEVILEYQKKEISKLRKFYSGRVITIPKPYLSESQENLLQEASKENNYLYIDNFRNYYNMAGAFIGDLHPNQKGHRIIAEDIFNYLKTSMLIPCN